MSIKVKIETMEGVIKPKYETIGAAGMDMRAYLPEGEIILYPGKRVLVPSGIKIEIPEGYEIQVRPRSGLALKKGISLVNTPGTVDYDYRGDVGAILINHSNEPFEIKHGDRICQLVLNKFEKIEWVTGDFSETERGIGGFGHTGGTEERD